MEKAKQDVVAVLAISRRTIGSTGAAGRAVSEFNVVGRGQVNRGVRRDGLRVVNASNKFKNLFNVLREARTLLALPDNDFSWSSWQDTEAAIREIDVLMLRVESGSLPPRLDLEVLFAPTGPIQEVTVSSGWGQDFIRLADRFDAAAEDAYGRLRKIGS